MYNLIMK